MSVIPEAIASRIIPLDRTLETLETPAVLIDVDVAEGNLQRWRDRCAAAGLRDRPHIKTHRTIAFARRQIAYGAIGVTCQTVGEAEIMAAAGIDDILITTNSLGAAKLARLAEVARKCRLTVVADSPDVATAASEAATAAGAQITVLIECETGARRCGISDPAEVVELARRISVLPGLTFGGLATYPPAGGRDRSTTLLRAMRNACETAGLVVRTLSTGGTPDMWSDDGLERGMEYRAGTYIYNDRSLVARGAAAPDHCALTVLATVVSRPAPDRAILDAGSKSLTSDLLGMEGHGMILEYPDAVIYGLSEEHGHVDVSRCANLPKVGERVHVLPNHACVVANMFDRVFLIQDGELKGALPVDARGRSI
ncbi:MAG: alanine racemase [Rhizobiales bacterium]|nr:alanine racemase [Hyphomicrobiales bacterium]MDQ3560177.1 alanine racemase [Pseudomonadota bacterium]